VCGASQALVQARARAQELAPPPAPAAATRQHQSPQVQARAGARALAPPPSCASALPPPEGLAFGVRVQGSGGRERNIENREGSWFWFLLLLYYSQA